MTRACLLAAVLAAGCSDAPPAPTPATTSTVTSSASPTPAKPVFKEPDPEIR